MLFMTSFYYRFSFMAENLKI